MSERTESMKRTVERDEQRIQKLQESIRTRKEKIRELENEEILGELNSLSARGLSVRQIVAAMKDGDADTLFRLIKAGEAADKSGTGSALETDKEAVRNEQSF